MSVGAADLDDDRSIEQLMGRADQAMYTAKRAGGDRLHVAKAAAV